MGEIINATYNFLDTLDNSSLIKNLTIYKQKLLKDKKVLSLINEIKNEHNPDKLITKRKLLYQDNNYKMYMKYYNELSLIILKINHKYHKYTNTKEHNCHG